MLWFILALCTAFMSAIKDVYVKHVVKDLDEHYVAAAVCLFAIPFLVALLFVVGIPPVQPMFWVALVISGTLAAIGSLLIVKGLKIADVSITIPFLSFTPALMLITSPLILGEFPSKTGIVGILLIVTGSYVVNIARYDDGIFEPFKALWTNKGSRYALIAATLFSITTNVDKIGIQNSSAFFWSVMMTAYMAFLILLYALYDAKENVSQLKTPALWPLGIIFALLITFHMIAIQMALVPYVIAIKRSSILFAIVLARVLFHERQFKAHFSGAMLMVFGVVLIGVS